MKKRFDPLENYNQTKKQVGYVPRKKPLKAIMMKLGLCRD